MIRQAAFTGLVAIAGLFAVHAHGADFYWQGGTGQLTDSNYSDGTNSNLPPGGASDVIWFGADGSTTLSGTTFGVGRMRIGHNQNTLKGSGTVTLTNGALLDLTNGAAGTNSAALWVGQARDGVLNIEESSFVTASRLVNIGVGSNLDFSGTINVRSGGILSVNAGDIVMGTSTGQAGNGVPAFLTISDADSIIAISGGGADLDMAPRLADCVFTQTDGIVTVNDLVQVTAPRSRSVATSFNISGGSFTTGTGEGENYGNFFVGRGASENATVNISGAATLNVGHRYLMGGSADTGEENGQLPEGSFAKGVVTNHTGGTLNVDRDIRVADVSTSATSDSTYYLSGDGVLNTNVANYTADSSSVIGRQGIGKFIQTGGTANFNSPLVIGNREAATATTANGLYEISAGGLTVNAAQPTWPLALNIAPNGTGELRVIGDDASIDVIGDFAISSTENGNGTLAFELETGDLLSTIDVSGTATFNAGSILTLDLSNASPTQMTYDVLTATSIVDSGITFGGPSHWGYQIVPGGNGQILQLIQTGEPGLTGDHNQDGRVDAADYVAWRKLNIGGPQGYNDFVENFGEGALGAGGAGQVPEPAALGLVGLALLGAAMRRHRRFRD